MILFIHSVESCLLAYDLLFSFSLSHLWIVSVFDCVSLFQSIWYMIFAFALTCSPCEPSVSSLLHRALLCCVVYVFVSPCCAAFMNETLFSVYRHSTKCTQTSVDIINTITTPYRHFYLETTAKNAHNIFIFVCTFICIQFKSNEKRIIQAKKKLFTHLCTRTHIYLYGLLIRIWSFRSVFVFLKRLCFW